MKAGDVVYVAWCPSGCVPEVFTSDKAAEDFREKEANRHFNVTAVTVQEEKKDA